MRKHCNCAARPPQCLHSPPAAHAGHGDVGSARPSVSYETSALFSTLLPTFFQMWCNLLRGGQFLVDCIFMGMFAYWFKPAVLSMAIRYATSNGCEVKGGLKTTPCEMAATPLCTSECPELFSPRCGAARTETYVGKQAPAMKFYVCMAFCPFPIREKLCRLWVPHI